MPNISTAIDIVKSLLPFLITLVVAWLNNRNERAQRRQLVEDAEKQIELISAYVNSQSLVLSDPAQLAQIKKAAADELYEIKTFLDEKLKSLEKASKKSDHFLQHFFLLYQMNGTAAGIFRVLFFLMLLLSIPYSFGVFSNGAPSLYDLLLSLVVMLPAILLVLLFRWLAIRFDKPTKPAAG
jgi:hypothetical protein